MIVPFCKDCAHKVKWGFFRGLTACDACQHPDIRVDVVTGKSELEYCSVARLEGNKCGPRGILFQVKMKQEQS